MTYFPATASEPLPATVILAGGKGTRLAPLTLVLPKPLVPLVDGPIIDVLLRQLRSQGWTTATLAVGHMAELMRAYCGDGARYELDLDYLQEIEPLGTVGPLAFLPEDRIADGVLAMNGDLLTTLRFPEFITAHRGSNAIATVAVYCRSVQMEFGVLEVDGELGEGIRQVKSYREKPQIPALVSMGIYLFEPEALRYIEKGRPLDLPDLIHKLLADNQPVGSYAFGGYWLDIGRHSDYQQAIDDFASIKDALLPPVEAAR